MSIEAQEIMSAVNYYNTQIYCDMLPMEDLGSNSWIYPIGPSHVQTGMQRPDHVRFMLFGMTLGHRINQTQDRHQQQVLAKQYLKYRGHVIRSLTAAINTERDRPSDLILVGIMSLLLTDAQHGVSLDSRCHIEAIARIILLRGGIGAVAKSQPLDAMLICFLSTAIFANTSTPAEALFMTEAQIMGVKELTAKFRDRTFMFSSCPAVLFACIANLNHLRYRASHRQSLRPDNIHDEAMDILKRVESFCPSQWSNGRPASTPDWELIGAIYQSAVALFCISSMQSLSVFAKTAALAAQSTCFRHHLQSLLRTALQSAKIQRYLFWPLLVLGVDSARDGDAMRAFVKREMLRMSSHIGTCVPIIAQDVLVRFWTSGETHWDACFDRPYTFATQIAIDTSRISTSVSK
ncbi:hypothetical protein NLG97_g2785 [Lecanicillium saksenae]|uniref:Uncharacterized protein n=1 Tax=Lecanicillium saksenae TaxID=468837 RepID=A0ACC1R2K0_9HYPO|nr:hypothetical protein NLG97_g2785 [Lecanicillium saksenae]